MGVRVNDPLGPFTRTIVPSDTESVNTVTPKFCGEYTYSYAPTNVGETFPFTQTKFLMTDDSITFASDDVADVAALNPNPFSLTLTVGLVDYPLLTVTQDIQVEVVCEVYSVSFDTPVPSSTLHEIIISPIQSYDLTMT